MSPTVRSTSPRCRGATRAASRLPSNSGSPSRRLGARAVDTVPVEMRCRPVAVRDSPRRGCRDQRRLRAQGARGRAQARARRGRRGKPRQDAVPRQYEPRAAHAAERGDRLLRDPQAASCSASSASSATATMPASSMKAASISSMWSTTFSICRRSRPASSGS